MLREDFARLADAKREPVKQRPRFFAGDFLKDRFPTADALVLAVFFTIGTSRPKRCC